VLLNSRSASDADISSMSFALWSDSKQSAASVTFTNLTIRADSLKSAEVALINAPQPISGPVAFGAKELPAGISWNCQGPLPDVLQDWGGRKQNSVVSIKYGAKLIRSAKVTSEEQVVGYTVVGDLVGDFEVTLDFRDFASTPVLTDWRVPRVDISASIFPSANAQQSSHSAGLALRRNHNGDLKLLATQGEKGTDGKFSYKTTEAPVEVAAGRLRLVRQGSSMFYQFAPSGTESWQTIRMLPIDPGPVRTLSVGLRAEDLEASAETVLTHLTIRAQELRPRSRIPQKR
jgi:hypothetical protein